jgi:hypothetical protein
VERDRFDEMAADLAAPLMLGPNMTGRIAAALRDAYNNGRQSAFAECIDAARYQCGTLKGDAASYGAGQVLASIKSRAGNDGTAWIRGVCREHVRTAVAEEREACAKVADEKYETYRDSPIEYSAENACANIADAIRARGGR